MGCRTKLKNLLSIHNKTFREFLAEFLGTFILIVLGDGSVAQYILSKKELGSFLSVNWAWGVAVTLGVYASAGVSGGHINPAVSLAMAVLGRLKWWKTPIYMLAQYLGAFVASACIYGVYLDALNNFDGGVRQVTGPNATAGIWATYPQDYVSISTAMGDQILGTAILTMCVLAITDPENSSPQKGLAPIAIGFVVLAIGTAYGMNCGYPINPARDLGPRMFTAVAGWGLEVFSFRNYLWFWVPVAGPHIGALMGAFLYQLFIGMHWPDDDLYTMRFDNIKGLENKAYGNVEATKL